MSASAPNQRPRMISSTTCPGVAACQCLPGVRAWKSMLSASSARSAASSLTARACAKRSPMAPMVAMMVLLLLLLDDLDPQLVDLLRGLPGLVVHPEHGLLRRARRQAEHLPRFRVKPSPFAMHFRSRLDR